MTRTHCFLFGLAILALSAVSTPGQVATGTPPFGSYAGGPDVINLANLNSHIDVPIMNKPGRGMAFTYDMVYDSSVWYPVGVSGSQTWQPVWNWGWVGQTQAATGFATYIWRQGSCNTGTKYDPNIVYYDIYIFVSYYDQFGRAHDLGYTYVDDNGGQCPNDRNPFSATIVTGDGSGYQVYVQAEPVKAIVYPSKGGAITPPLQTGGSASATATDRNGNQISVSGGVFTDTLGTTALTVSGSGTPSSPITFGYTAPSGGNAAYTMKYTSFTIQTKFNCSGIGEYSASNISLVTEVDLPDVSVNPTDKYTFTYETTPNDTHNPHYVTGRLASMTLPTGGEITYAYSGGGSGVNGISCADGSAATLTRTTPDGTWTYAQVKGTTPASTTTITDPQGNNTVVQFQGLTGSNQSLFETERQVYQGSISSGNLLETINTCYNGSSAPCTGTALLADITQRTVTAILPGASNLESQHIYKYNSNGSLTEQDDYDWGSGVPGPLLKKTAITLAALGTYINALRQQVTVTNGSGTTISQTIYNYDGSAVVTTSGTPQHVSVSGSRGNLTSINYYTQGSTYLTKSMTYFDTGNVQTVTDVNGAQTTYTYGACGNSFPTAVAEPLSLSRSMTWNCTGSVELTVKDENSQTTTTAYSDPYFWRPASITDPTSAVANYTYPNQTQVESVLSFNSGNSASDVLVTFDDLGRQRLSQSRQAPGSTNFDTAETDYDSLGRPYKKTLPFTSTAGTTNSSAPGTTKTYDALSRVTGITDSGGGTLTKSYPQNDVLVTRGPAPSGENTKRRQLEYDGLGRLTSVCEITSGTSAWPGGTCAQNTTQTGYWTKYTYNALGNLTGVMQNAQSSSTQSRAYTYDLMGRLISETNPESGTKTYVYDYDSTMCGGGASSSSGDLVKTVDAAGNCENIYYDALHRLTDEGAVQYCKRFRYDNTSGVLGTIPPGVSVSNKLGHLVEAETDTCAWPITQSSILTDEWTSYTVRGQPSDFYESTPHSSMYYHIGEQYWANGALEQLSGLSALPTFTFAPDGEGRPYQASASSGQNPVTNTVFNSASLPTAITYGSADSDSYSYDSNTDRITQYQFNVNSQSLTGALTWNANHTLSALNITDALNSADTQSCSFSHDDLTRLVTANCGSVWSQTFGYDPFGNLSSSGSMSFQPTYSVSTNRMTSVGSFTPTYDANGDTTADPSNTYTWNADGRPLSISGVNLTYDALGRMVEQNRSGAYTQIVYGPNGGKFALMTGSTLQKALVPLPGGSQAVYNSSGLLYYGHSDHLGSVRLGSSSTRTVIFDMAYAPFGETYATSGSTDPAFTTQRQDTVANVYDFPAREYNNFGRWPSPDPSGLAAVHPRDPQTLNRYAYVRNNPLAATDPQGLDINDEDGGGDNGGCSDVVMRLGSSHGLGHAHANDVCGEGGGGGGGGGGTSGPGDCGDSCDPTSGGDPSNSGGDCDATDPNCGGSDPADPTTTNGTQCTPNTSGCSPAGNPCVNFGNPGAPCDTDAPAPCVDSSGNITGCTPADDSAQDVYVNDPPLNANATQILSQAYNDVPGANILTMNPRFSSNVCTTAAVVSGFGAIAFFATPPPTDAIGGAVFTVAGAIFLLGCD